MATIPGRVAMMLPAAPRRPRNKPPRHTRSTKAPLLHMPLRQPTRRECRGYSRSPLQAGGGIPEDCWVGGTGPFLAGFRSRTPAPCRNVRVNAGARGDSWQQQRQGRVVATYRYEAGIMVDVIDMGDSLKVVMVADPPRRLWIHWAVECWSLPAESARLPVGTIKLPGDCALESPFLQKRKLEMEFEKGSEMPHRVVFVLKEEEERGERWINNLGCDFAVHLRRPEAHDVLSQVVEAESTLPGWGLYNRWILADRLADDAEATGTLGMGVMAAWLRMSQLRLLPWYGAGDYAIKDLAHLQLVVSDHMAGKASGSPDPAIRRLARVCLASLPRGGGGPDAESIRMCFLDIFHTRGLREGHRDGEADPFLEGWYEKIAAISAPDDVAICCAYLRFLEGGGRLEEFDAELAARGEGLTRGDLARLPRHAITAEPIFRPELLGPFRHVLWLLKVVHSRPDVDVSAHMAGGALPVGVQESLRALVADREAWWAPGAIVDIRRRLEPSWRGGGVSRDVLMLDIALGEHFARVLEGGAGVAAMGADELVDLMGLALRNAAMSTDSEELHRCAEAWEDLRSSERWGQKWKAGAAAALEMSALAGAAIADDLVATVQIHVDRLAVACGVRGEGVAEGLVVELRVLGGLLVNLAPHVDGGGAAVDAARRLRS